nr:hypothetical protein [Tanacetum cinerariifolium]
MVIPPFLVHNKRGLPTDYQRSEIEACLTSESILPRTNDTDLDLEGYIRLLEEFLNNDPSLSPLPLKELNVEEIKTVKSSIDEPPELELKELPSHLEYAYLEGTNKLPMIIAKGLKEIEKEALLKLSLPELTSTQMILELADRSTTRPVDIAEDIFVKVGKFHFPTDFVVVDYVVDPRVPLILRRPFLQIERALIDVYACEEYVQEVLGFSDNSKSDNSTPISDPVIALSPPSLTPFEGGDFILEEIEACLTSESILPRTNDTDLDLEGYIRLLEEFLNNDPSLSPLPLKELNVEEIKTVKSSIDL